MTGARPAKPWVDTPARQAARARMRDARAERVRERHEAFERESAGMKVLLAGIDTLNLSSSAQLNDELTHDLLDLKAEAVEAARQEAALPRWRSNALGIDLEVQPHGSKKGALVLKAEEVLVLVLAPNGPRNLPTAYVELKAPFLWTGWEAASKKACDLLREVSATPASVDVQASRVDLAVDFMGWQPDPTMLDQVIGKVVRRNTHFELVDGVEQHRWGRRFTGFTFGGGDLRARLYDKTVELKTSGKHWFVPKWQDEGYVDVENSGHVWRLEFQIRREPIRQAELVPAKDVLVDGELLSTVDVKSWERLQLGLNDLWSYLMRKWLTYRLPRIGKERVRLHPRWKKLLAARFTSVPDGRLLRHSRLLNEQRCLGAIAGYLRRDAALWWLENKKSPDEKFFEEDLDQIVAAALARYKARHGETLFASAHEEWERHVDLEKMLTSGRRKMQRSSA